MQLEIKKSDYNTVLSRRVVDFIGNPLDRLYNEFLNIRSDNDDICSAAFVQVNGVEFEFSEAMRIDAKEIKSIYYTAQDLEQGLLYEFIIE